RLVHLGPDRKPDDRGHRHRRRAVDDLDHRLDGLGGGGLGARIGLLSRVGGPSRLLQKGHARGEGRRLLPQPHRPWAVPVQPRRRGASLELSTMYTNESAARAVGRLMGLLGIVALASGGYAGLIEGFREWTTLVQLAIGVAGIAAF